MAIDLVQRAEWRARAPKGRYDLIASTRGVKVHYTGGRVNPAIADDHDLCAVAVRGIQNGHMDGNGWMDIGYSLACCPHRKVFVGRGPKRLPAANGPGLNAGHYAVLGLVGTSGLVIPPDDMLHGIRDAIEWLRAEGGAGGEIKGHRDGFSTNCPGSELYSWVKRGAPRPGESRPVPLPTPGAPAWPGRLLSCPPVMRGDDVCMWQARMRERGWRIAVDGAYGQASAEVCGAFQAEKGLTVDRRVGPLTWAAAWQTPIT